MLKRLYDRFLDNVLRIGQVTRPQGQAPARPPEQRRPAPGEEGVGGRTVAGPRSLEERRRGVCSPRGRERGSVHSQARAECYLKAGAGEAMSANAGRDVFPCNGGSTSRPARRRDSGHSHRRIYMRLLISTALALTAALVAAGPAIDVAAAQKNRSKDIKVIVSFKDGASDRIQSDGVGAYQDGVGNVVAYISASNNGQLIFGTNTSNQVGRTLRFFFDDCLLSLEDCNAPWNSLDENSGLQANVLVGADKVSLTGGLTAMKTTDGELSAWIKFNIPLDSDPAYWNVCFDSRKVVGPCGAPGGSSTDARIRRDASDRWTIFANGTNDRADLIRDSNTRKSRTYTVMGTYSMPFEITVQCVNAADCP
jgi:hypothetical protein